MIHVGHWLLYILSIGPGGSSVTAVGPFTTKGECLSAQQSFAEFAHTVIDQNNKNKTPGITNINWTCMLVGKGD